MRKVYILLKTTGNPTIAGVFSEKEDAIAHARIYGYDKLIEVDVDDPSVSVSVTTDGESINYNTERR